MVSIESLILSRSSGRRGRGENMNGVLQKVTRGGGGRRGGGRGDKESYVIYILFLAIVCFLRFIHLPHLIRIPFASCHSYLLQFATPHYGKYRTGWGVNERRWGGRGGGRELGGREGEGGKDGGREGEMKAKTRLHSFYANSLNLLDGERERKIVTRTMDSKPADMPIFTSAFKHHLLIMQ